MSDRCANAYMRAVEMLRGPLQTFRRRILAGISHSEDGIEIEIGDGVALLIRYPPKRVKSIVF